MLLKEFVTQTLMDIIGGIAEAQRKALVRGAEIAPRKYDPAGECETAVNGSHIYNIDFEIELTSGESSEGTKGIAVALGNVGFGAGNKKGGTSTSNTNVKFTIPVTYPEPK